MLFIEIIVAVVLGLIAGTFTGIFPGIHINLVSALLISALTAGLADIVQPMTLVAFIVAMAITHTFLDFIPSIYLGAPGEDSYLSILPGHELLKEGRGHEAVLLTLFGSLAALPIIILFTFIFIKIIPSIYTPLKTAIPFILIFISLYLILREKDYLNSFVVFILAGFLGYLVLNMPVKQPFLPLLTGLFGASTLVVSINNKETIPQQKITPLKNTRPSIKEFISSMFAAAISAPLSSFLPGMGSGQAAVIGSELVPQGKRGFLILVGAINTIVMALSFVTLYIINKTRTGAASAIQTLLPTLTPENLTTIIAIVLIVGILDFFVGIQISKYIAKHISKVSYRTLSITIILILLLINIAFSYPLGVLIFCIATALGVFAILSRVRRINLMGALLLPTILFYLVS